MEGRPACACHGEPMMKDGIRHGRQRWRCSTKANARQARLYADPDFAERKRASTREWYRSSGAKSRRQARYDDRRARGVCVNCDTPRLSEALCWTCLNRMEVNRALSL